jgi:hypothetical protein
MAFWTIFASLQYLVCTIDKSKPQAVRQLMYRGRYQKTPGLTQCAAIHIFGFRTFALQGEFI